MQPLKQKPEKPPPEIRYIPLKKALAVAREIRKRYRKTFDILAKY
jgi:hypothetical protein